MTMPPVAVTLLEPAAEGLPLEGAQGVNSGKKTLFSTMKLGVPADS